MDDKTKEMIDQLSKQSLTSFDDSIPSIPNVEIEEREMDILSPPTYVNANHSDADYDYVMTRSILYTLIQKQGAMLEYTMQLAKIDQNPKTLGVMNDMVTTIKTLTDSIFNNQKRYQDLNGNTKPKDSTSGETPSQKTVIFEGTPMELKKMLKGK